MMVYVYTYDDHDGGEVEHFIASTEEGAERKVCLRLLENLEDDWDWSQDKETIDAILTHIEDGEYSEAIDAFNTAQDGQFTLSEEVVSESVDIPLIEELRKARKGFNEHYGDGEEEKKE